MHLILCAHNYWHSDIDHEDKPGTGGQLEYSSLDSRPIVAIRQAGWQADYILAVYKFSFKFANFNSKVLFEWFYSAHGFVPIDMASN